MSDDLMTLKKKLIYFSMYFARKKLMISRFFIIQYINKRQGALKKISSSSSTHCKCLNLEREIECN